MLNDPTAGNALVLLVLLAGAAFVARGVWMFRNAPAARGAAAERTHQRSMAWVVAGCMFLSIPGLVGYVATPPSDDAPAASRPL